MLADGTDINLEELRARLAGSVALVPLIAAAGLVVYLIQLGRPVSIGSLSVVVALSALSLGVLRLNETRPRLACHLLVWALTLGFVIAMAINAEPWLPFTGLTLVFISGLLITGAQILTGGALLAAAAWLGVSGARAYPLTMLLVALVLNVILTWLVVRTLYTALEWAWTMQQRADHLLELARERQSELASALKSVDTSNAILRRTQRELIAARQEAEEARLMKERFAANVSHELRTPLSLILGFSEVMCLSPELYGDMAWSPSLRQDVYQIYRSSRYLLDMIDDILDLSRFEMVGFTLDKEPTDLESLLGDTLAVAQNLFRGRNVRLEGDIEEDLPAVQIDRVRIRQVVLNLLKNAARVTEVGAVRVTARRGDGEVVVSVADTGPGIPADQIAGLFQEFHQVDVSLDRAHGGVGLGLAICKHFVEAHLGRIWVESEAGAGATFSFTLPIAGEFRPFLRLSDSQALGLPSTNTQPVLAVVDPDPAVAMLVDRHIEGYTIVQVEETRELLDVVRLHHPQAVVWNVRPGAIGASETVMETVARVGSMPVIECSLPSHAWVANDLAVMACLTKPLTAERLMQQVDALDHMGDILIIDDDRAFCRLVERILRHSLGDISLRQAYDGADGLRAMRRRRPDLLILDLVMPHVDGFQVLEEMRGDGALADVPVVLLTATSLTEDALTQRRGQMLVQRPDGLSPMDTLRCLGAVIGVLRSRYREEPLRSEDRSTDDALGSGAVA